MKSVYSTAEICRPSSAQRECLELEPDLANLFATSRDWSELEWAWNAWRKASGYKYTDMFVERGKLANKAARMEG